MKNHQFSVSYLGFYISVGPSQNKSGALEGPSILCFCLFGVFFCVCWEGGGGVRRNSLNSLFDGCYKDAGNFKLKVPARGPYGRSIICVYCKFNTA